MPRIQRKLVPWRSQEEWEQLKTDFFTITAGNDNRRRAVDHATALEYRGHLPEYIVSTAALVNAVLAEEDNHINPLTVQHAYAEALSRFVTTTCDLEQDSVSKQNMHLIAEDIGMPFVFVEMRHAIVHGDLPSLTRLSRVGKEAIQWIYDYYWDVDDELPARPAVEEEQTGKLAVPVPSALDFRRMLKHFSKARKEEIKEKSGGGVSVASEPAARDIINLCRNSPTNLRTLSAVLLEEKFLIPALRNGKRHMAGAVLLWQDLLQRISIYQPLFLETLLGCLVMFADLNCGGVDDTLSEAALFWVKHICTDEAWRRKHQGKEFLRVGDELKSFAVNELLMGGSSEGERTAREIMESVSGLFEKSWEIVMRNVYG